MSSDADSSPPTPLPEAGNDPGDPNAPTFEDKDTPPPLAANPAADMDDLSDNDSVLSDVDEAQFEDFDPANIDIDERPSIAVDEDNVRLLGRHKRKRDPDGVDGEATKKKKEGRREKPKKSRKKADDDDVFSGGEELEGNRRSRKKKAGEGSEKRERKARQATPEDEENLDPEEKRRRALDRAMDLAIKNPNRRRKQDGINVVEMADEEIASLRARMAKAAEDDLKARASDPPGPAMHKLKLLPEVTALLNRNGRDIESAIVDPENNLLESVRFFLEPLHDGSLPAYNIQRDLFAALARLPITKDALISSGIGKVVLFYTRSKKPELGIKRQAERLLAEWTRPILKRSDDYRKRILETKDYDPTRLPHRPGARDPRTTLPLETAEQRRARELAPPTKSNRARLETQVKSYTIVPKSNVQGNTEFVKPVGASGDDAFRRMKARQLAAMGKGPKRG